MDDFKKAFNSINHKGTNFFHMNIYSLSYNFDQLHTFLSEINISFDVIGIQKLELKNKESQTLTLMDITLNTHLQRHLVEGHYFM